MAKILPIILCSDEILRKKSTEISEKSIKNKEIKQLAEDMKKTMITGNGIGLAAPQVGKNIRLIVINLKDEILTMINPKITKKSWLCEWGEEGCLSVPGSFGSVKRNKKIICSFFNAKGEKDKIKAEGLLARVIQHEIDHLDGILFIDKAKNVQTLKEY